MDYQPKIRITPEEIQQVRLEPDGRSAAANLAVNSGQLAQRSRNQPPSGKSRLLIAGICGLALGLLISIFAISLFQPGQPWLERIDRRADQSIVRIEAESGICGTGFVVASSGYRHLILTNRHVLSEDNTHFDKQYRVLLRSGELRNGRLAAVALEDLDLALLEVQGIGLRPLGTVVPFSKVRVGGRVAAVGHPMGLDYSIRTGASKTVVSY